MEPEFKKQLVNFPSPFMRAMTADSYSKGESQFSVTELISPPQRQQLKQTTEKMETPYSTFYAMLGTAIHSVLELHVDESAGEIAERRMFHAFEIDGEEVVVSGQIDFYEHNTISDYKFIGGIQEAMKPDHYKQVQMNGFLAEMNCLTVHNVAVVYIQRDWKYLQSKVNPKYPQSPFKTFIHPYDREEALNLFNTTIRDHLNASRGMSRSCTREEQWAKPDTYAVMKPGAQRATRVYDSYAEAKENLKPGQIIQERKGERTYCESFCGYSHACKQFQQEKMNP